MSRFSEVMARAERPRRTVPIVLAGNLAERIAVLQDEIAALTAEPKTTTKRMAARPATSPRLGEAQAELDAAYAEADDRTLNVVVEALGGTPWEALKAAYPPDADGSRWSAPGYPPLAWGVNVPAAAPELLRQTAVGYLDDDETTVVPWESGELDQLLGTVGARQKDNLIATALIVTRGDDAVPLRRQPSTTETSADA